MPPSGRSSSSRSGSSGSRPSSRSSSSHSSRPGNRSTSKHLSKGFYSETSINFAKNNKKPIRVKPSFVSSSKTNYSLHHCFKHDYYHFKEDFYDESGNLCKKGYYDESGQYYESLDLKYFEISTVYISKCKNCENNQTIDFSKLDLGQSINCSKCGSSLNMDSFISLTFPLNTDFYIHNESEQFVNEEIEVLKEEQAEDDKVFMIVWFVVAAAFILLIISSLCYEPIDKSSFNNNVDYMKVFYENKYYDYSLFGEEVYVPEIDRECRWDDEYYYDSETDCYFCFNTDVTPPNIQYWFEDFSSQYGDYGWLEYDYLEKQWYVEIDYNTWIKVDNPPDYFWFTSFDSLVKGNNIDRKKIKEVEESFENKKNSNTNITNVNLNNSSNLQNMP